MAKVAKTRKKGASKKDGRVSVDPNYFVNHNANKSYQGTIVSLLQYSWTRVK